MKLIIFGCLLLLIVSFFFTSCQPKYEEKDGKVYYKWYHGGTMQKVSDLLPEADAATFETIKKSTLFSLGKDKNHVFKDAKILLYADPKTFECIKEPYWKDKTQLFILSYSTADCRLLNADPSTFKVLQKPWSKDKNQVFYSSYPVKDALAASFVPLTENYGKDALHYFYNQTIIDGLDYKSAVILSNEYIKDKQHVYYTDKEIKGANPKTFKAGQYATGYDDKYSYNFDKNSGPITEEFIKMHTNNE